MAEQVAQCRRAGVLSVWLKGCKLAGDGLALKGDDFAAGVLKESFRLFARQGCAIAAVDAPCKLGCAVQKRLRGAGNAKPRVFIALKHAKDGICGTRRSGGIVALQQAGDDVEAFQHFKRKRGTEQRCALFAAGAGHGVIHAGARGGKVALRGKAAYFADGIFQPGLHSGHPIGYPDRVNFRGGDTLSAAKIIDIPGP